MSTYEKMERMKKARFPKGPYNPVETEEKILKFWKKGKFAKPEYNPKLNNGKGGFSKDLSKDKRKPFCIIMPPPNANARPHLGNVSGYSYQDLMGRYWRMKGRKVLLLPGKDHAGIQSEAVFEREVLNKKGLTKLDLGREEFYKQCYEFCIKNSEMAWKDEERVGVSADFDRNTFTLDKDIVDLVLDTFLSLYKDKLVYKGVRITNWCPKCMTALADADTERRNRKSTLIYIRYPILAREQKVWSLNFSDQRIWEDLVSGRKTVETRALNPNEKERYFGDIKSGDVVVAVNKLNHSESKIFSVIKAVIYKDLNELFKKEDLSKIFPSNTPKNIEELRNFYKSLQQGYLDKIKKSGIIAIEIKPFNFNKAEYITIATTRPETMLADTAIAVNPKDKRYKKLIGKKAIVPLVNREVPIIQDPSVNIDFGTGALKVTPAHASEDYEIMLRWNKENPRNKIEYINVVWKDSKLYGPVGKYFGKTVKEAQKEVIEDLEKVGLLEKTETTEQNVAVCERCKTPIEPLMSSQWYIKVEKLKKKAIEAVKKGKIKIHPKYMERMYFNWMENLRDWPISRSLWWGYRFPVWYKGKKEEMVNEEGKIVETVGGKILNTEDINQMRVQKKSPGKGWFQDEDVFDTWFSSGQWPFVTLTKWNLMKIFYPTDVMETMYDILPQWVARMIMLGIYKTGKVPFRDVYLHGMLKAPDGQKMSKSKGNVITMDDVVKKHGADTLRLFYYVAGKAGGSYNFDWKRIKFNQRFLNKVWNAARFVLINTQSIKNRITPIFTEEDRKITEHVKELSKDISQRIEKFKFNIAAERVFKSFWHTFCDKYIESTKSRIYFNLDAKDVINLAKKESLENDEKDTLKRVQQKLGAQITLKKVLKDYLKILHPFTPFITEALWQYFREEKDPVTIMHAKWPT